MAFEFNITKSADYSIIQLSGNLIDKLEANQMLSDLNHLIEQGNKYFILDLQHLKFMNSSGIGVLISILTKARSIGGEVVICKISPKINQLLVITKLNSVFKITNSIKEAEEELAQK